MKFENTQVSNFSGAFRGMRNPMASWDISDSAFGIIDYEQDSALEEVAEKWVKNENNLTGKNLNPGDDTWEEYYNLLDKYMDWLIEQGILTSCSNNNCADIAYIGPNDLSLAQKLIKASPEHAKFMRQIHVSVDITAPLYFWKEFDTYKIGTTANSTSTMHKLANMPITIDHFEIGDYEPRLQLIDPQHLDVRVNSFLNDLEQLRQLYLQTGEKIYWKELIRWLPESWLQTRTITMNYAVLRNIYFQRKGHKLTEWHQFCDWVKTLPYGEELITLQ